MKIFAKEGVVVLLLLIPLLAGCEGHRRWLRRRRRNTDHQSATEDCKDEKANRGDLSSRSLSPWKYKICTDLTRYPPVIRKAECLQKHCNIKRKETHVRLISVPLTYSMDVRYKRGKNITFETLEIPIGCTCIYPRYST